MSTARPSARNRGSFLSATEPEESKPARKEETKKTAPPLVKVNWLVEPHQLEEIKLHAVKSRRKIYQVLQEALGEYLHRRQA